MRRGRQGALGGHRDGGRSGGFAFFSLASFTSWYPGIDKMLAVERAANWPAFVIQRAMGAQFRGLAMEILTPDHIPPYREPLFEAGRQPDQRDWLWIEYLPEGRARLGIFHAGTGDLAGSGFAIPPNSQAQH